MKRMMMIVAVAVAMNFAGFGIQAASANDAHHPAGQTTKAKKVKKVTPKRVKGNKSSMMMNCPMMAGNMMQGGMMKGGMMQNGMMQHKGRMKCPMMGAAGAHQMGMMHGAGSDMGMGAMRHGEVMMGHRNPCWVTIERERNFGYQGACNH